MYRVRKTFEIAGAHQLELNYQSPCENLHGHNWMITIEVSSGSVNENGMVIDFKHLSNLFKKYIHERLDHKNINKIIIDNPTAENLAYWVHSTMNDVLESNRDDIRCTRVEVQESRDNVAIYEG